MIDTCCPTGQPVLPGQFAAADELPEECERDGERTNPEGDCNTKGGRSLLPAEGAGDTESSPP